MADYNDHLDRIYAASNGGLDIIIKELPQTEACRDNVKKKFKLRPDEHTPSACLLPPTQRRNYWAVVDYGGGEGERFFSPIDIVMRERSLDFTVALHTLAVEWNVDERLNRAVNMPRIEKRPALPNEHDGEESLILREGFSQEGLAAWGKGTKPEALLTLGWAEVEQVIITRGSTTIVKTRTEGYPIFRQRCEYTDKGKRCYFDKVYEPQNLQKEYRFHSIGTKPRGYIFGLEAIRQMYSRPIEIFIVSGGSDAVALWSRNYAAVYMGSECDTFGAADYKQIKALCASVYNIPDIDATGIAVGRKKALLLPEMQTIWLRPDDMYGLPDKRGKARKDLKDYLELHPEHDAVLKLMRRAMKAEFWEYEAKHDHPNSPTELVFSPKRLNYFLELHGFFTLQDDTCEAYRYIRIEGILVSRTVSKSIRNFIVELASREGWDEEICNKLMRCHDLPTEKSSYLHQLPSIDIVKPTATMQPLFFRNCWVEVTKDSVMRHTYNEHSGRHIWKDKRLPFDYRPQPKMFDIKQHDDGTYEVWIDPDSRCKLMKYFRGTARLHWRKELEQGQPLTDEEKAEEAQCLVSRIANTGYLMHGYKSAVAAYGTLCVDYKIGQQTDQRNGRSGKSLYAHIFEKMTNGVWREGNKKKVVDSQFFFGDTTEANGTFIIDECHKWFDFTDYYGRITNKFHVEQKNQPAYNISFEDSPHMLFCTNFVNLNHDSSTEDRLWYQPFSDYYHVQTEFNDYLETRKVSDDVGCVIMESNYADEDWQMDAGFLIQCLQYHLSLPENKWRIDAPMMQIRLREAQAKVNKSLAEWANDYLAPDSGHLDVYLAAKDVRQNYYDETRNQMSAQIFTRQLKDYCQSVGLVYNPASVTKKEKDGESFTYRVVGYNDSVRCIYIKSADGSIIAEQPKATDLNLPF